MKLSSSLPWIIAGTAVGYAIYALAQSTVVSPRPRFASGDTSYDAVDHAAARTGVWGVGQRASGAGASLAGKLKEGVGRLTGNDQLADEGAGDQLEGKLRDTVGKVAGAAARTLHDLNV